MEKTYKAIKTLEKLGMVLSTIAYIFCIIGVVGCLIGIIALSITGSVGIVIDGKDLATIIEENSGTKIIEMISVTTISMIMIGGEIALAYFAKTFFKRELERQEVFTAEGAKEMKKLGILAIIIPIVSCVVASIVYGILSAVLKDVGRFDVEFGGSIGLGIMFILLSIFIQYGAELKNKDDSSDEQ